MPVSPLTPGPERPAHELLAEVRPRERAPADRPFVYVAMIATVDGRAALDGRSAALGDEADLEMLLELRALADAVLIGTGTLRAEGYDRLVRSPERRGAAEAAGLAEDPLAVLISRRFDVPWEAGLFPAAEQPVLIYAGTGAGEPPDVPAPVEVVRARRADARRAAGRAALARRAVAAVRGRADAARRAAGRRARRRAVPHRLAAPHRRPGRAADRPGDRLPAPVGMELKWVLQHGSSCSCDTPYRVRAHANRGIGRARRGRRLRARGGDRAAAARRRGALTIADLNAEKGEALAAELGDGVRRAATSPTPRRCRPPWQAARRLRISVCCAGVGWAEKTAGQRGPHSSSRSRPSSPST